MVNKLQPDEFKVVQGIFVDNTIVQPDNSVVECITYLRTRQQIEMRSGFFHLIKQEPIKDWVIFQYCLDCEPDLEKN